MARPPKKPEDRKDVDLRIPVTQDQKKIIMRAAEVDQMDMAGWARMLLLKTANQRLQKDTRKKR